MPKGKETKKTVNFGNSNGSYLVKCLEEICYITHSFEVKSDFPQPKIFSDIIKTKLKVTISLNCVSLFGH